MKILQAGVAKSGNFWLWKLLQQIIEKSHSSNPCFFKGYLSENAIELDNLSHSYQAKVDVLDIGDSNYHFRVSSIIREEIVDIDSYLDKTAHVWTHSYFNAKCQEVLPKFNKVVYIVRDPRDVAISQAKFTRTSYMLEYYPTFDDTFEQALDRNYERIITNWVIHVASWMKYADEHNIYILSFEALKSDFDAELEKLLKYLEISLDTDEIEDLKEKVSFKFMKRENPNHVNKGIASGWKGKLSTGQVQLADSIAGPLLDFLNYDTLSVEDRLDKTEKCPKPEIFDLLLSRAKKRKIMVYFKTMLYMASSLLLSKKTYREKYKIIAHAIRALKIKM